MVNFFKEYGPGIIIIIALGIYVPWLLLVLVLVFLYLVFFGDLSFIDDLNHPKSNKLDTSDLTHFMFVKAKYLRSDEWVYKRSLVLERDNHQCKKCGSTRNLAVHHLSGYNLIPKEPITCLVTLCSKCHQKQHDKFGYPQTYKEYMNWSVYLV